LRKRANDWHFRSNEGGLDWCEFGDGCIHSFDELTTCCVAAPSNIADFAVLDRQFSRCRPAKFPASVGRFAATPTPFDATP